MALIEFQDLPDTTTPLNAENLNNNFKKNIIMGNAAANITTGSNTYDKVPLVEYSKVGDNLSISNGGIKIGEGISKIKVSGTVMFQTISGAGQRHHMHIRQNNTVIITSTSRLQGTWETISSNVQLFDVNEDDIIYLYVRTQDGSGASTSVCRLTVEAVE